MSDGQVDITGLDKAVVLAGLYNGSRAQGLGMLHLKDSPMTVEEAAEIIETQGLDFEYLHGRVMKVHLQGDHFYSSGYDRDNGQGKAQAIITELRRSNDVASELIEASHIQGTHEAAMAIQDALEDRYERRGNVIILSIPDESAGLITPVLMEILGDDAGDLLKELHEKHRPTGEVSTPEISEDGLKSVANESMIDLLRRNYQLGSVSNAILAQEAAGQKSFVESDTLPIKMSPEARQTLEKAGVQFLGRVDQLFQYVKLPEGWTRRATSHDMHSHLVDGQGRVRAYIFYKASIHDKRADLTVKRRFHMHFDSDKMERDREAVVEIHDAVGIAYTTAAYKVKKGKNTKEVEEDAQVEAFADAKAWLQENYPRWEDPSEYWDDAPKAKNQPDAIDVTPGMWYLVKETPQSAAAKSLAGKEVGVIAVDTRTGTCSVHTADIFTNHSGVAVTLPLSDLTERPAGKTIRM